MPADATYCPDAANQKNVIDSSYTGDNKLLKEHLFNLEVPTLAAASWHCKYHLTSSDEIATAAEGYIYLEAEQYGFDDNVFVYVQPRGKFYPFNFQSQTNNPDKMSKIFKSQFGRKFLIPAEYDIMIDFAPIKYSKANVDSGYQN